MNMMQFDKDSDGKLTKEELPEQAQAFFDRMDTNGDGSVDVQKWRRSAAAWVAPVVRAAPESLVAPGGPGGPGDGGGRPKPPQ